MGKIRLRKKDILSENKISKLGRGGLNLKKGKILCIILHEGKGSSWVAVDDKMDRFSVNGNTYFKVDQGTYLVKDAVRFMLFLEGISLPINHGYIEKEEITKTIKDRNTGEDKTYRFQKIKGLKFDSKLIDILLNRHLADEFTRQHMDMPNLVIIILLVAVLVCTLVGIGVQFR